MLFENSMELFAIIPTWLKGINDERIKEKFENHWNVLKSNIAFSIFTMQASFYCFTGIYWSLKANHIFDVTNLMDNQGSSFV